jgi:hypothetical protein
LLLTLENPVLRMHAVMLLAALPNASQYPTGGFFYSFPSVPRSAVLTPIALTNDNCCSARIGKAALLNIARLTGRAAVAGRIKVEIGKVRGPWLNVIIQGHKKGHVVSIIPAHLGPGFFVAAHASKPEMLPGVWELPSYSEEATSSVELIRIQLKMLS